VGCPSRWAAPAEFEQPMLCCPCTCKTVVPCTWQHIFQCGGCGVVNTHGFHAVAYRYLPTVCSTAGHTCLQHCPPGLCRTGCAGFSSPVITYPVTLLAGVSHCSKRRYSRCSTRGGPNDPTVAAPPQAASKQHACPRSANGSMLR
jgi:hypothetical protein